MKKNMRRKKRQQVSPRRSKNNGSNTNYNLLEQRLPLTTFVVTSLGDVTADDGALTLREAIIAANTNVASGDAAAGEENGDIIRFDPSLADGTINLTQGQLAVSEDLAIQAGDLNITVDAAGLSRAFEITSSETVSLGRLNITGGNADIGGGVLASGSGNVIVFGGEYSGNVATGEGGGAIYSGAGNLFIDGGGVFDGNIANGASGSGGAIFNDGGIAVAENAVFTANIANRAGGAIEIAGGDLFLSNTTFGGSSVEDGNIAGPEGAAAPGNGGALHVTAGDTVSIAVSTFDNNFAALEGGALWNQAGTSMFVNGSTLQNNIAAGDAADDGGGAIFNNGGDLFINTTTFRDNVADGTAGSGGAILSVDGRVLVQDNSEFSNNLSARAGGAVELIDGEFFDTGSVYTANETGVSLAASPGNGGAFHITGTGISAFNGTEFDGNLAGSEGGAVWNSAVAEMFITDVVFTGNVASGNDADNGGGAIYNNGGNVTVNTGVFDDNVADGTAGSGGAILSVAGRVLVQGESTFDSNLSARAGGAVELVDGDFFDTGSVYTANETGVSLAASPGNGGAFHITGTGISAFNGTEFDGNLAGSEGGAVWNSAVAEMFITDVVFTGNVASGNDADNGGGAIYNNGGDVTVNTGVFDDNVANGTAGSGGAILSVAGRILVQGQSTFDSNLSARAGGAVELVDGAFFDTGSLYSANETGVTLAASPGNGGAFHITGSGISAFNGTNFNGNLAGSEGGGVWNSAVAEMFLTNVVLTGNVASGNAADNGGGGIFNNGGSVFVNDSTISNNVADGNSGSGGGALSVDGVIGFDNSSIDGNQAARAGGGIEVIEGRASFSDSTLNSNTTGVVLTAAPGNGGGLHVSGNEAIVTFLNSIISGNSAANQGGGLWNQTGSSLLLDDNISLFSNTAQGVGGGVYNRGFLSALDTVFTTNNSEDDGGAIYTTPTGQTRIENSSIDDNTASDDGGGVFNLGNLFTLDSIFANNVAGNTGGAIFTTPEAVTTIGPNNSFVDNLPNDQNG